jgi:hypothetical protein
VRATSLETLALWQGMPVRAAVVVDVTDGSPTTRLGLDGFADFSGPPLYTLELVHGRRRRHRDGLDGLGRFHDMRQLLQPYVRFDRNDCSIPHDRIRQLLTLIASETEVRIADAVGAVLAAHRRSDDSAVVVEDPAHLEKLTAEKRRALELRRRDRLRGACPSAAAFLEALAQRGEPIGTHAARLARLLDDHGAAAVETALVEALRAAPCPPPRSRTCSTSAPAPVRPRS